MKEDRVLCLCGVNNPRTPEEIESEGYHDYRDCSLCGGSGYRPFFIGERDKVNIQIKAYRDQLEELRVLMNKMAAPPTASPDRVMKVQNEIASVKENIAILESTQQQIGVNKND